MADGVFRRRGKFGEGLRKFLGLKQRIIAKAGRTARLPDDLAGDGPFANHHHFGTPRQNKHTPKSRRPHDIRSPLRQLHLQFLAVCLIACTGPGVTRRINTGLPA